MNKDFIISGSAGLDHSQLREVLSQNGFREISIEHNSDVGFVFLQTRADNCKYDVVASGVKTIIKNILNDKKSLITNKENLHSALKYILPGCIAETWNLRNFPGENGNFSDRRSEKSPDLIDGKPLDRNFKSIRPGEVFIARPVGNMACSGRDISIITNDKDLHHARKITEKYPSAIISRYILNPLLLNGKKFHLRMYLLVQVGGNLSVDKLFKCELWSRGKILTARDEYAQGEYHNKFIHDTHSSTTECNLWFPEDLPNISHAQNIYSQMKHIAETAGGMLRDVVQPYPESKYAFEIFGCDFMIDDNYKVILIEINDRVGFKSCGEPKVYTSNDVSKMFYRDNVYTYSDFSRDYFEWMYDRCLRYVFTPELPRGIISTFGVDVKKCSSSSESIPKTFIISGNNGLDHGPLREILFLNEFTEVSMDDEEETSSASSSSSSISEKYIGFMCLEQYLSKWDSRAFGWKSHLKNLVNDMKRLITDKGKLYDNFVKISNEYTVKTKYLEDVSSITRNDVVLIIRPIGDVGKVVGGGVGIKVITNTKELNAAKHALRKYPRSIVSEYIRDVYLHDKKKCHIRTYFLVRTGGVNTFGEHIDTLTSIWDKGIIITARDEYVQGDWGNTHIHDSHAKSTDKDLYYPDDFQAPPHEIKSISTQIQDIGGVLSKILVNQIQSYPESTNAYEVFGVDLMVARGTKPRVVLLEVNDHVGYSSVEKIPVGNSKEFSERFTRYSREYWEWVYTFGISPYF